MKKSIFWLSGLLVLCIALLFFWTIQTLSDIKKEAFEEKKNDVVKLVQTKFDETSSYTIFEETDARKVDAVFERFFGAINNPIIFRVKVFSLKPEIIWSNLPNLIGTSVENNDQFEQSVATKAPVQAFKSLKSEVLTERQFPTYTETYVPVVDEKGVVRGVIEVYENDAFVNEVIKNMAMKRIVPVLAIAILVFLVGSVLIMVRARRK